MFKEHLIACVAMAALGVGSALAQTNQPAAPPAQAGTAAGAASEVITADKVSAGTWRASKLIGVGIYGPDDEKVGDVNDVLVDRKGQMVAIVVGVGGFLGIGEKDVAIPFGEVEWSDQPVNPAPNVPPGTEPAPAGAPSTATTTMPPAASTTPPATDGTTGLAVTETKRMYPDHGRITMTKQQLNDAPKFEYPG
jgi:sporulation protein YlmC with PRC-barrel domain